MTETYRLGVPTRSVLAGMGALALALGLLAQAPSAHPSPPRDADGRASTAEADSPIALQRHAGATRYETSARIATDAYDASTDVVLASGEDFADALAGAALEGSLDAPVLLVPRELVAGAIPVAITEAIDDLGATSATLLGGTDAVSGGVADYVVANSTVQTTERVSGATRFETAEAIAEAVAGAGAVPDGVADRFGLAADANAAFVATGLNWPDSMAAGPGAFAGGHPILLTTPDSLHPAAERGLQAVGADVVFLLGGTSVVSADVASQLHDRGYDTVRLAGPDRWATAKAVADAFADDWGYGVDNVGLATGFAFADALASAPLLGNPAPLVLTPTARTHATTSQFFSERGCDVATIDVFGGQAAVQRGVAEGYAETACQQPDEDAGVLDLLPQDATNPTTGLDDAGVPDPAEPSEHSVTATLTDSGGELVADGQLVRFEVYDRDHQDARPFDGAVVATSDGDAGFAYEFHTDTAGDAADERTIDGGGDDIIVACAVPDRSTPCVADDSIDFDPLTGEVRNIVQEVNATAEKAWRPRAPETLEVTPEEAVNLSEQRHTVTAAVTDQFGDPSDALDGAQLFVTVLDAAGAIVDGLDGVARTVTGDTAEFTYTGPTVSSASERVEHRIIVCDDADPTTCLDDGGDLAGDVLADDATKQWVEQTAATTTQTNWQNEVRDAVDDWGGVDDFAADALANDGNATIDVAFNSDLGVVSTDGQVTVSAKIPDDASGDAGFQLHAGGIDAEGAAAIVLQRPVLVSETDPDGDGRGTFVYDVTGTVADRDAAGVLAAIDSAMDDGDGETIDWYLNVATAANPDGEVRGQLQDLAGAGNPAADGGLSRIPAQYEQLNFVEDVDGIPLDLIDTTALPVADRTVALQFDTPVDKDPGDLDLLNDDFTVTVGGTTVGFSLLTTDPDGQELIYLVLDQALQDGDRIEVTAADSALAKLETSDAARDGIGDGDVTRSLDTRGFRLDAGATPVEDRTGFPRP